MPNQEISNRKPGEQVVVTANGVRPDGRVFASEADAEVEAASQRKKLQEQSGGATPPKVEVKRQIFG